VLIPEVVELEDDRVVLAAVHAAVICEVRQEKARALESERLLPLSRLVDIPLPVRRVVALVVGGSARPAEAVELTPRPATPGEIVQRLQLAAVTAPFHSAASVQSEHTFA
jgi:hypothetical protein